ncbi:MAG: CBS domain-containing protein [Planctomycetes bacterium]|nr:CBS domain-containing protein [Planctomycetota bacterium]
MRVSDIATLNVKSCRPDTNLAVVASIMWEKDCGVVPVVDERNKVLGVVTDRDICMATATRSQLASQLTASDLVTGKAFTCRLTDDPRVALRTMATNGVRRLPVVDENGILAGMLSMTDLILASHDTKSAKMGQLTWSEVIPMIDVICHPRSLKETPAVERKQALVARV